MPPVSLAIDWFLLQTAWIVVFSWIIGSWNIPIIKNLQWSSYFLIVPTLSSNCVLPIFFAQSIPNLSWSNYENLRDPLESRTGSPSSHPMNDVSRVGSDPMVIDICMRWSFLPSSSPTNRKRSWVEEEGAIGSLWVHWIVHLHVWEHRSFFNIVLKQQPWNKW